MSLLGFSSFGRPGELNPRPCGLGARCATPGPPHLPTLISYRIIYPVPENLRNVPTSLNNPGLAPLCIVDKTIKAWSRDKTTLPEDLHYSGHDLVRLKVN